MNITNEQLLLAVIQNTTGNGSQVRKMESVINQPLWQNGPTLGSFYDFPGQNATQLPPAKHTLYVYAYIVS